MSSLVSRLRPRNTERRTQTGDAELRATELEALPSTPGDSLGVTSSAATEHLSPLASQAGGTDSQDELTGITTPSASNTTAAKASLVPSPARVWDQAYDALKSEDPELVEAYETIASSYLATSATSTMPDEQQNTIAQENPEVRRLEMQKILRAGLARTEHEAKVKDRIKTTTDALSAVKGAIDLALKAAPEASLPWAAVCVGLEVC